MFLDDSILALTGLQESNGKFGIEVEADADMSYVRKVRGWRATRDGSMQHPESVEFVMEKPLSLEETKTLVRNLYEAFRVAEVTGVGESMRAGIHVHVNCQRYTMREIYAIVCAYYCLEQIILTKFGEDRKGNLFCLGLEDANFALFALEQSYRSQNLVGFGNENIRNSSVNLSTLTKYGSLEFRAMMTPPTEEPILDWIEFLDHMTNYIVENKLTPHDIVLGFSAGELNQTLLNLVGPKGHAWLTSAPNYEGLLFNGIREVQFFALNNDWA